MNDLDNDISTLKVEMAILKTNYVNLERLIEAGFARLEKKIDDQEREQQHFSEDFAKDIKYLKELTSRWKGVLAVILGFSGFVGGIVALFKYIKW